jgi:hypothetical protein
MTLAFRVQQPWTSQMTAIAMTTPTTATAGITYTSLKGLWLDPVGKGAIELSVGMADIWDPLNAERDGKAGKVTELDGGGMNTGGGEDITEAPSQGV